MYKVELRGRLKTLYEDFDGALADFANAIKLDKKISDTYGRGILLCYLGRYAEAVKDLEQAVNQRPKDFLPSYHFAIARYKLEGLTNSVLDLVNKSRTLLRNRLIDTKDKTTFDGSASRLLEEVNILEKGMILYCLGGLEAVCDDLDKALDYLEQAMPLYKNLIRWARHDPAWLKLQNDLRFQSITSPIL